jgi:ribosomal protein S18 acetylase RimI-like enzyme
MPIRLADRQDEEQVCRLLKILQDHHVALRSDVFDIDTTEAELRKGFVEVLDKATDTCFVAEEDGKVVGVVMLSHSTLPASPKYRQDMTHVKLQSLVVDPDYRRRGIAKALMVEGQKWAREKGAPFIWLMVWTGNTEAVQAYEKEGWVPVMQRMEFRL